MEILSVSNNINVWFFVPIVLVVCVLLIVGFFDGKEKNSKIQMIICLLTVVFLTVGGAFLVKHETSKQMLKVIITDMEQVDLNKYKITGNEGKVITLQEK